jgi:Fe2+ transport system protein FeoA
MNSKVVEIDGDADFRLRMMEMGFVRDTDIEVVKFAPLYDPMEFVIKGYHLVLRREQAEDILMEKPGKASGGSHE